MATVATSGMVIAFGNAIAAFAAAVDFATLFAAAVAFGMLFAATSALWVSAAGALALLLLRGGGGFKPMERNGLSSARGQSSKPRRLKAR